MRQPCFPQSPARALALLPCGPHMSAPFHPTIASRARPVCVAATPGPFVSFPIYLAQRHSEGPAMILAMISPKPAHRDPRPPPLNATPAYRAPPLPLSRRPDPVRNGPAPLLCATLAMPHHRAIAPADPRSSFTVGPGNSQSWLSSSSARVSPEFHLDAAAGEFYAPPQFLVAGVFQTFLIPGPCS